MSDNYTVNIDEYAKFVIEKWQTKIITLGITDTRALLNSFTASVQRDSNGDPKLISFVFNYYGKFLDMGVFGYAKSFDWIWLRHAKKLAKANSKNVKGTREIYPWYSPIFARQVRRLADLMARQYGYESVTSIKEAIQGVSVKI